MQSVHIRDVQRVWCERVMRGSVYRRTFSARFRGSDSRLFSFEISYISFSFSASFFFISATSCTWQNVISSMR